VYVTTDVRELTVEDAIGRDLARRPEEEEED
jgi:hypothetical protein